MYRVFKLLPFTLVVFISMLGCENRSFEMKDLPKYSTVYNKDSNPHQDLKKALKKAKKANKRVLLIVGGDWCKWCGTLDNFLEDNEPVAKEFYSSFEVVKVYYAKDMNEHSKSLLKQFPKVEETPYFYILDNSAKLIQMQKSSPLERGYSYNKQKVLDFIKLNRGK